MLSDTYFCNFSLFQSMPDSWAVKQLFPIMPIHRLNEMPSRSGVLGDISCDSDGKIDQFIDRRDVKKTLPLHPFNGEPYLLGAFLVGAYQEILGDLHNLFGDTNAVHVSLGENGDVILDTVMKGDTVREVLDYVQFNSKALLEEFRRDVETALREGKIGYEESGRLLRFYEDGLERVHVPRAVRTASTDNLRVVLVATRNPLNIGAAARAMSNFGFGRLRLVNPYHVAYQEARSAVHAHEILETRRRIQDAGRGDRRLHAGGGNHVARASRTAASAAHARIRRAGASQSIWLRRRRRCCLAPRSSDLSNDDLSYCH